jgi:hypothetical protein
MKRRAKAAGLHLLVSASVAAISALNVFLVWYPPPYAALAGGLILFAMLVSIDMILGPCLTALIASPGKPLPALQRDIAMIVLVQLLAFGYGMYAIASARPVHLVFEVDRFVIVASADIEPDELVKAPAELQHLPWTGPTLIGTKIAATPEERLRSIELALQGRDIAMQPDNWVQYSQSTPDVLKASRPAAQLLTKYPQLNDSLPNLARKQGLETESLRFLPLVSRKDNWVVVLATPDARIVGFLPVDGFF